MPDLMKSDLAKFAIAAAVVAVLAVWGIHGGGFGGGTARQAQEKLQVEVDQRVAGAGAGDWARVTMRGQLALIEGYAPSEEDLAATRGAVRSAVWDGGWLLGGVAGVRSDDARVWAEREGPYPWRAELDRSRLVLAGAAPSRDVAHDLETLAAALFVDRRVINDLDVDPVPPDEGWDAAAQGALVVLSHLEVGSAELRDFTLDVTGSAATAEEADAARESLERLIGVVSALSTTDIRAPRPPAAEAAPPPASAAAPVDDASPEAEGDQASLACQTQIDALLVDSDIHFDVNSADLTAASLPLLEQIAAVAAACPPLVLRIEGHTDDTGVPEVNQSLSERRAAAVVERLAALGVDPARLRAVGRGATDPAAANATADGRRENRRIEIIVER